MAPLTRSPRRGLTALAAGGLLVGGLAAPALARDAATPSGSVSLANSVLPGISGLTPAGPAAADTPMNLAFSIAGSGDLGAAYTAIYTPGSPDFQHFLTPAQVASEFGAPAARWNSDLAWLRGAGLNITYASGSRDLIEASGTASRVESLLGVRIDSYQVGALSFLANTAAPLVPAALGVQEILGLNTLERAVPESVHPVSSSVASLAGGLTSDLTGLTGLTGAALTGVGLAASSGENIGIQTPQDIWGAYDEPASDEGAGQTVAMFGEGESATIVSDLSLFEKDNGFPHVPVTVDQVGPGPFTDNSGSDEWDLDTQAEVGMAPEMSGLKMYFGNSLSDATVATMFSAWQSDPNGPPQADASFGECEENPVGTSLASVIDPINSALGDEGIGIGFQDDVQAVSDPVLERATLEGRTLFSGAGDTGSSCPVIALPVVGAGNGLVNQVVPLTNYPASSPYVVGVGGTVLYTNGSGTGATRASEYAWTFGGGGDSLFIPAPAYQEGVANLTLPCISTATGGSVPSGEVCRGVPDVSAMSGDGITNGYPIISDGAASDEGGTSLSGPLWAGMWARVQADSHHSGGAGFANEVFYRLGKNPTTYARDFYDITTGLLGAPVVGNGLYTTQTGWDYATGWGTPKLANLIDDVDG